jgi:hypothetical protein
MASLKKSRTAKPRGSEALVLRVLERVATILLRLGFDAPNTEYLLRCAFVLAARKRAELAGTRTTQSQIAFVAGVNRLDVRKIVAARLRLGFAREIDRQSRVERIVEGWRQDSRFVDARGRPRSLTIAGRTSEFENLARKYGRDVTARTLRDTLVRSKLARVNGNKISLAEQSSSNNAVRQAGTSDLSFLSTQLASFDFQTGRRSFVSRHLSLPVKDSKSLKLFQRKAISKIETALGSLESVDLRTTRTRRGKAARGHRLLITTTVTSETDVGELT